MRFFGAGGPMMGTIVAAGDGFPARPGPVVAAAIITTGADCSDDTVARRYSKWMEL